MKIIHQKKSNFLKNIEKILFSRIEVSSNKIDSKVKKIINEIILHGDKSLIKFTKKYDQNNINKIEIKIPKKIRKSYQSKVENKIINAFKLSIKNITNFHKKQYPLNYKFLNIN